MLKPMKTSQKDSFARRSSSMRPVIFGNQKWTPAIAENTTVPNRV